MVEFVSYNGRYPNFCRGELVVRINGEEVNLGKCLCSGGWVSIDWQTGNWTVTRSAWSVENIPEEYEKYIEEITEVVNDNVEWGCCGGCT